MTYWLCCVQVAFEGRGLDFVRTKHKQGGGNGGIRDGEQTTDKGEDMDANNRGRGRQDRPSEWALSAHRRRSLKEEREPKASMVRHLLLPAVVDISPEYVGNLEGNLTCCQWRKTDQPIFSHLVHDSRTRIRLALVPGFLEVEY